MTPTTSTPEQDERAHAILDLLTETTSRQISREIAHMADIAVDTHDDGSHVAPPGLVMPSSGAITTLVVATLARAPGSAGTDTGRGLADS